MKEQNSSAHEFREVGQATEACPLWHWVPEILTQGRGLLFVLMLHYTHTQINSG